MSGGSIGSALGTGLGMLLAPETGGASLLIPAGLGALGGAAGAGLTGGNVLTSGLEGGAGGLAGGFLSGLLGGGADAADGTLEAGASADEPPLDASASALGGESNPLDMATAAGTPSQDAEASSLNNLSSPGISGTAGGTNIAGTAGTSNPSGNSNSGSFLSNLFGPSTNANGVTQAQANAMSGAKSGSGLLGSGGSGSVLPYLGLGLSALGALMPSGSNPVSNVNAAPSAAFSAPLPTYNYNSVQTPYTGNWYTYGQRPTTTPMVQNTVTSAARGGLMRQRFAQGGQAKYPQMPPIRPMNVQSIVNALPRGVIPGQSMQRSASPPPMQPRQMAPPQGNPMYGGYAMGGRVRSLAMGGPAMQAPMGQPTPQMAPPSMPPQQMARPQMGGKPQDPRAQAAQFAMGKHIGQMLRGHIQKQGIFSADGMVNGHGKGQDDAVPARLSKDEYVVPAEAVSQLGDGSSSAGGKALDKMVHNVRAHKTSKGAGFPPRAKSPLEYLGSK